MSRLSLASPTDTPPATQGEKSPDDDDNEGFQPVTRPKPKSSKRINHTKACPLAFTYPPYVMYWNYKITVVLSDVKDGNVKAKVIKELKQFFIHAKKVDHSFMILKYYPTHGEPDVIKEAAKFPTEWKTLEGEGPSLRYKNAFFHGLRIYNPRKSDQPKDEPPQINIYTELRVGFHESDMEARMKEWVMTQVPQPYLRAKDLQAPNTREIGFLFGANPFMRDQPAQKVLKRIAFNYTTSHNLPPIEFAVTNRWINEKKSYKKKGKNSWKDDKPKSPMEQMRALHIEAFYDDRSRTKAILRELLKHPEWKAYTNAPTALLPSMRDAENATRAAACLARHKKAMQGLSFMSTTAIYNPDKLSEHILKDPTNLESDRSASLRDIIMAMETKVIVKGRKNGERYTKTTTDKLFQSLDPSFKQPDTWILVYPTAYKEEAEERIRGLYLYVFQYVQETYGESDETTAYYIKNWFTADAIEEAEGMEIRDGRVVTAEEKIQSECTMALQNQPWFVGEEDEDAPLPGFLVPTVEKSPLKYDEGDIQSVKTQNTTATKQFSDALNEAIQRAAAIKATRGPTPLDDTANNPTITSQDDESITSDDRAGVDILPTNESDSLSPGKEKDD